MLNEELISKAREFALSESKKYGSPIYEHIVLAEDVARRLAEKLGADIEVATIGALLMDIKQGEALRTGRVPEHAQMSADAAVTFLVEQGASEDIIDKVEACALYHHGTEKYPYIEAEIAANTDCYRFLHPKGFLNITMKVNGIIGEDTAKCFEFIDSKLDEKHAILSLDVAKAELEEYYQSSKEYIRLALEK